MNSFSRGPLGLSEISDQRISKHKSLCEGLFGYTSARSIIDLAAIFTPLGLSGLEISKINVYRLKHVWYVVGCTLKVRSYHRSCNLSSLNCSEEIICTFALSPYPVSKEPTTSLKSFGENRQGALSQIFCLFHREMLVCYPKMLMARGAGIPRVSMSRVVGIQYEN